MLLVKLRAHSRKKEKLVVLKMYVFVKNIVRLATKNFTIQVG